MPRKSKTKKSRRRRKPRLVIKTKSGRLKDERGRFISPEKAKGAYVRNWRNQFWGPSGKRTTKAKAEKALAKKPRKRPARKPKKKTKRTLDVKPKPKPRKKTKLQKQRAKTVTKRVTQAKRKRRKKKPPIKRKPRDRAIKTRVKKPPKTKKPKRKVVDWRAKIKQALISTREATNLEASLFTVRNADGSVDGELRFPIPPGMRPRELVRLLSEVADIPDGSWFTVGLAYSPTSLTREARRRYLEWHSMIDVAPTYVSNDIRGGHFADVMIIADDMEQVHDVEASQISFRLNYNGNYERPERKGRRAKRS